MTRSSFLAAEGGVARVRLGVLDCDPRFADVPQPAPNVFLRTPFDQVTHRSWRFFWQCLGVRLQCQDSCQGVGDRTAGKGPCAGQHLVEQTAEAPDIGTLVGRLAACLLGGHVGRGAEHHARNGAGAGQGWRHRRIG